MPKIAKHSVITTVLVYIYSRSLHNVVTFLNAIFPISNLTKYQVTALSEQCTVHTCNNVKLPFYGKLAKLLATAVRIYVVGLEH